MKLGPVTKLDKRNMITLKNSTMMSSQQTVTSLSFFNFMARFQPSGSRIPDASSIKLTFSLIITFYFKKTENRINKSLTQPSYYCFE